MSAALRGGLLTVLGLGRLRPAPGTWGSAAAVCFCLGMLWSGVSPQAITIAMLVLVVVFSVACVWLGRWAEKHFGRSDPSEVVADEIAGQALALVFLPWDTVGDGNLRNLAMVGTAFAAFRLFDILKPPPIQQIQRAPAGWGILLDDLLAGVAALGVVQLVFRVLI